MILDRYIFRKVLTTSLGATGVLAFILLMGNVVKDLLNAFAARQIDLETFVRLVLVLLPFAVSYALPMGILAGILLTLGRLSADGEINALRAVGWGLPRIAAPVLAVAVLGTAVAVVFDNEIGPRSMGMYRQTLADAVRTNPLSFVEPMEFVRDFPGYVIFVAEKQNTQVRDLAIWNLDELGRVRFYLRAERASIEFDEAQSALVLTPYNGMLEAHEPTDPQEYTKTPRVIQFARWDRITLPLGQTIARNARRRNLTLMTYQELQAERKRVLANPEGKPAEEIFKSLIKLQSANQEHFVMAFAVLSLALVGVPLGIKVQRRESSVNLALALVLALTFYLMLVAVNWAESWPECRPDLLLWVPNVAFWILGLWLFRRVDRI